jgi:hypothetical protein
MVILLLLLVAARAQSQTAPTRVGLDERAMLESLVEDAVAGRNLGGNAWLTWMPHFFRGTDGTTYVPFTLKIEEAAGGFRSAAMYVRFARRGDAGQGARRADGIQNPVGIPAGELPVNSPERRQGAGAPTASDASLMLRSLTAKPAAMHPYEAAYRVTPIDKQNSGIVSRSLAVAPGEYDVYVALLDAPRRGEKQRRSAIAKQQVSVPDLNAPGLRLSSVVVADRIESLTSPMTKAEQALRPYALGAVELVPALDNELRQSETLHLAFVIYGAAGDERGMPDVRVEYRLYQGGDFSERVLGATPPQTLDRTTLPPRFDLRTGGQLAVVQSLPLASFPTGSYRITIRVIDNRSGLTTEETVRFAIL